MATIVVSVDSYKFTFTYDVTSTNTSTTISFPSVTANKSVSSIYGTAYLEIDGTVVETSPINSYYVETLKKVFSFTKTYTKTTSAAQHRIRIVVQLGGSGDNSATFTVPALASYAVTYNGNSSTSGSTASQTKYYGQSLTLRGNGFTRTGYTFKRWNTNTSDTGTAYNAGATYSSNAALSLYAIWNRTVSYNANNGTGAPAAQTAVSTSAITLSTTKPTRSGWTFVNWNTAANGSGTSYSSGGTYAANNPTVTLYAQWARAISSVSIGNASAIRVDDAESTVETDEGEFAYIQVPYSVTGSAAANVTMGVTAIADSGDAPTVTLVTYTATKSADNTLSGTFIARASGCDANIRYIFNVTVTAENTSATQTAMTVTRKVVLAPAYFTMDVMAGGHGIAFGAPAVSDIFKVAMPATFTDDVTLSADDDNFAALKFASQNRTGDFIKLYGGPDANGDGIVMGAGGAVVVGSGESPEALYDALSLSPGAEATHIASDGSIYFWSNCNTIANRKQMMLDTAGTLNNNGAIVSTNNTFYADSTVAAFDRDGAAPSADAWKGGLVIRDKDKENFAQVAAVKRSSANGGWNEVGIYPYAENSSGTQIDNALVLGVKSDGSRRVLLNQAAWLSALGLNTLFKIVTSAASAEITLNAGAENTGTTCSFTGTTGYKLAAVVSVQASSKNVAISNFWKRSETQMGISSYNPSSSQKKFTITVTALFIKDGFGI